VKSEDLKLERPRKHPQVLKRIMIDIRSFKELDKYETKNPPFGKAGKDSNQKAFSQKGIITTY
jgi:hypothetical protein